MAFTQVIIIGTSLGGLIAMAMALAIPSSIKGVVLNDIGPEIATTGRERILKYIGTDSAPTSWDAAVDELKSLFPNLSLTTDQEWLEATQATYRLGRHGCVASELGYQISKAFAASRCPTKPMAYISRLRPCSRARYTRRIIGSTHA
ncbi:MAG: alpha/beta fold hydrolase [Alphaproteobacteria bacterium]